MATFALLDEADNPITALDFGVIKPGYAYSELPVTAPQGVITFKIKNISAQIQYERELHITGVNGDEIVEWAVVVDAALQQSVAGVLLLGDFAVDEVKTYTMDVDVPADAVLGGTFRAKLDIF